MLVLRRKSSVLSAAAVVLALATAVPSLHAARSSAGRDGWPDTRAGIVARKWVEAFAKGDSAMRVCLTENLAAESLEEIGMSRRLSNYRASRERFGTLVLGSIEKSKPTELHATLIASDLSKHQFVFTLQSKPPYKLISVGRLEHRHSSGGHGFGH